MTAILQLLARLTKTSLPEHPPTRPPEQDPRLAAMTQRAESLRRRAERILDTMTEPKPHRPA